MKTLLSERWLDAALDPHREPSQVRVQVLAWLPLARLDDLSFRRPFSPRLLWNYVREVGVRATLDKVASRYQERFRNQACIAAGVGRVLEAPVGSGLANGALVELVAPRHPLAAERVVLARELVRAASPELARRIQASCLRLLSDRNRAADLPSALATLAGWAPESGVRPSPECFARCLDHARDALASAPWQDARELDIAAPTDVAERRRPRDRSSARPAAISAVLFGYGNYAKTAILPSLPREIRIEAVHEIEPLQIPQPATQRGRWLAWDTAPSLRPDERPDVVFLAGFHHTHAPLAIAALERGAVAVVEKPVATTEEQLDKLLAAIRVPGRRLFSCFHKRYSPFNDAARADLRVSAGDPVNYHSIVYEVPLPARHWYRWPASRSRIVSNGCHWLDHFLFLNDFAAVSDADLTLAADGTVSCSVSLVNGAFFTMVLTERGSERLGVQDHVELRANGVTVTIENGSRYRAEGSDRVLRRRTVNRIAAYRRMYASIGEAIVAGEAGDSVPSVEASAGLVFRLERLFGQAVAADGQSEPTRDLDLRAGMALALAGGRAG